MSFDEDLATMRVRRVPRALRGAKGKRVKNMAGTGHSDEDIQHHLTNAMNGRSTDETRGHVFKALNAINKRQRADRSAVPSVQADVTATNIPETGRGVGELRKRAKAFDIEAANDEAQSASAAADRPYLSRMGVAESPAKRQAQHAREEANKAEKRGIPPAMRGR